MVVISTVVTCIVMSNSIPKYLMRTGTVFIADRIVCLIIVRGRRIRRRDGSRMIIYIWIKGWRRVLDLGNLSVRI